MTTKSDITVDHFYIFNSTFAKKEGEVAEDKKIFYYYPEKTDLDTKIRNVGLSEAIIKFTESFNPGHSCNYCHTHKTRQIYYQPEPNFWIVMIVGVPYLIKVKDGDECVEFQNNEVSSAVCQAIVKQAYMRFRLFMGSFDAILNDPNVGSVTLLEHKLDYFFSEYLPILKLNHRDVLDIFQGLQFLPLDKITFLKIQGFMNLIEATFPQVKYTAFLYNDHLVWSALEPDDMQVIYNYLVSSLLPQYIEKEFHGASMPKNSASPFTSSHYGKFITGTSSINESIGIIESPKVFINYTTKPISLYLVVYSALSATLCLFVESTSLLIDYLKSLDAFLGPQLTTLVNLVADQCSKHVVDLSELTPKYLYFNRLNLAYKSTIHLDNRHGSNILTTSEIMRIITDINNDRHGLKEEGEIIIKTMSGYWIVEKLSNLREFFVVLQQKNANIIEIDDEVKRLCDKQLKSIFFY